MQYREVTLTRNVASDTTGGLHGGSRTKRNERLGGFVLEASPGEPVTTGDGRALLHVHNGGTQLVAARRVREAWSQATPAAAEHA